MSSAPFCLGVPVVDDVLAESGIYVLRTRSYHDLALKVNDLQSDEVLNIFAGIRDYMVPFDSGDLLRIPFYGEMI